MAKYNVLVLSKDVKGRKIPYSNSIVCNENSNGDIELFIQYPHANVQTDIANFESIVFSIWSLVPKTKITLKYNTMNWNNMFPLPNFRDNRGVLKISSDLQHYMRFLYRVSKMRKLYSDFDIDSLNQQEIITFESSFDTALQTGLLCVTEPKSKSNLKSGIKVTENHLEKWFVLESRNGVNVNSELNKLRNITKVNKLYDQLPCGLFYGNNGPSEQGRIFNTGYFDLWGINNNNDLCIFELKTVGNNRLGIISELFFYSCLAQDFKVIISNKCVCNERGFNVFKNANKVIKAYFLAPEWHPFIESNIEEIVKEMNKRSDGVTYEFIKFDYQKVVGTNSNNFINNLAQQWGTFMY